MTKSDTPFRSAVQTLPARVLCYGHPLFGRLIGPGREYLIRNGWERVVLSKTKQKEQSRRREVERNTLFEFYSCSEAETNRPFPDAMRTPSPPLLSFVWPHKSGPQFPIHVTQPASVRPYPTDVTDGVDDKIKLDRMLAPSYLDLMPDSLSLEEARSCYSPDDKGNGEEGGEVQIYFVKHRWGVKGKSVHVYDAAGLSAWANDGRRKSGTSDYVIQREVSPPALDGDGRKFVLRAHLLLYRRGGLDGDRPIWKTDFGTEDRCEKEERNMSLIGALHEDIICLTHASPYERRATAPKSVHVSQAGKSHPRPQLVRDLHGTSHPAANVTQHIYHSCQRLLEAAEESLFSKHPARGVTCFALLGIDFLMTQSGEVKICEINSHPALGWGSMRNVHKSVFARLVGETLEVLLFLPPYRQMPFEGGTGFIRL